MRQALRVYTTQTVFWLWAGLWVLVQVVWAFTGTEVCGSELIVLMSFSGCTGILLGDHLSVQFAHPRARLLPGFVGAHFGAALLLAGVALLITGGLASTARCSPLTPLGVNTGGVGIGVFCMVSRGRFPGTISLAFWIILMGLLFAPLADNVVERFPSEHTWNESLLLNPIGHAAFGCLGIAALIAAGVRLLRLSEDAPGYSTLARGTDWNTAEVGIGVLNNEHRQNRESVTYPRGRNCIDRWFDLVFRFLFVLQRGRRMVLRYLVEGPRTLGSIGPMAFVTLIVCAVAGGHDDWLENGGFYLLSVVPFLGAMVDRSNMWAFRYGHLTRESLLPVGRIALVREMGLATVLDTAIGTVGHAVMILLALAFLTPHGIGVGFLVAWLALLMAQYLVGYHLMFWLVPSGRSCSTLVFIAIACFALPGITAATLAADHMPAAPLVVVAIEAGASFVLYRLAIQEWLRVDFDRTD
jgi:hypothetical protein